MTIRSRLLALLIPMLTAFLVLNSLFFYFHWSREFLLVGSIVLLLVVIAVVFAIAEKITKPVRQLNRAALAIAAGDYEANIQVEGPREIVELAQTLNTMSQCLVEHMSHLKENSLIRERMYGEYECSLLLQHYMLQKVVDEFRNSRLSMRLICLPKSPLKKGLFLKQTQPPSSEVVLTLFESEKEGFNGLFHLMENSNSFELGSIPFVQCQFIDHYRLLRYNSRTLFRPFIWSRRRCLFIQGQHALVPLEPCDMIFLCNQSVIGYFVTEEKVEEWLSKILRHFAEDGLDAIQLMLTNELSFLSKRQYAKHNIKILGLQIASQ